jgi:hypothetical protein
VDTENLRNSNPDAKEADENNNDGLDAGQGEDEDEALDDVSLSEENVKKTFPPVSGSSQTTLVHYHP